MTPDRSGRGAGCIDQDAVETFAVVLAEPFGTISHGKLRIQRQPSQIIAQPRHTGGRAIDRSYARSAMDKLCGLAAGGGAEIDDVLASDVAEQACRQGGGGVLYPPLAFGK